jgi:hypothetical protein
LRLDGGIRVVAYQRHPRLVGYVQHLEQVIVTHNHALLVAALYLEVRHRRGVD